MNQLKLVLVVVLCMVTSTFGQENEPKPSKERAAIAGASPVEEESLAEMSESPAVRGDKMVASAELSPVYRKKWALIVGVNYAERHDERELSSKNEAALPSLSNAVKDAEGVSSVLQKYYAFKKENVIELLEANASFSAIDSAFGSLCNLEKVGPDDCVVVFFSGHGVRTLRGTSFLAHDVHLAAGAPVSGHLRL